MLLKLEVSIDHNIYKLRMFSEGFASQELVGQFEDIKNFEY